MKRRIAQIVLAGIAVITLTACIIVHESGGADFAPVPVSNQTD